VYQFVMSKELHYWAIIPAAGTSERMGTDIPKQYLPLGESTVIENYGIQK